MEPLADFLFGGALTPPGTRSTQGPALSLSLSQRDAIPNHFLNPGRKLEEVAAPPALSLSLSLSFSLSASIPLSLNSPKMGPLYGSLSTKKSTKRINHYQKAQFHV